MKEKGIRTFPFSSWKSWLMFSVKCVPEPTEKWVSHSHWAAIADFETRKLKAPYRVDSTCGMRGLTRKPEVLSRRHRNLTVKDLSRKWQCSGVWMVSWRVIPESSAGRKAFHINWRWSSSRSSEWTISQIDWWTMSDWKENRKSISKTHMTLRWNDIYSWV